MKRCLTGVIAVFAARLLVVARRRGTVSVSVEGVLGGGWVRGGLGQEGAGSGGGDSPSTPPLLYRVYLQGDTRAWLCALFLSASLRRSITSLLY